MGVNDPLHIYRLSGDRRAVRDDLLQRMTRHDGDRVVEVELESAIDPSVLEEVSSVAEEQNWALRLRARGTPGQ
jgi:hypothetical protein